MRCWGQSIEHQVTVSLSAAKLLLMGIEMEISPIRVKTPIKINVNGDIKRLVEFHFKTVTVKGRLVNSDTVGRFN